MSVILSPEGSKTLCLEKRVQQQQQQQQLRQKQQPHSTAIAAAAVAAAVCDPPSFRVLGRWFSFRVLGRWFSFRVGFSGLVCATSTLALDSSAAHLLVVCIAFARLHHHHNDAAVGAVRLDRRRKRRWDAVDGVVVGKRRCVLEVGLGCRRCRVSRGAVVANLLPLIQGCHGWQQCQHACTLDGDVWEV
eukprot:365511-Chlamydomonas_euryale.AAC.13